ncbi:MAG: dienelactone hydrolase family protein [Deltaproteobacteria bacterium]|nr:dienelactone hydrolase family protein [Deltaproteobacteria bacterium]MCZ6561923.1 dienelactone hydrolase family protein [Deltaproteobacteria bacterium]
MEITSTTHQLNTSDGKMEAYEARPKNGGARPGIIVLMEAFGVNSHIKDVTERVAREGYVAIAPDLYHRESERLVSYKDLEKAVGIMNRLQDPKVMDDVGAAIAHLKSQSYVKHGAIGVTGFCMGGRFTYLTAAHHNKDIKAAVAFYGGGIPAGKPSPLDRTGEITCPITLFFGGKDPLIPQEHVDKINQTLKDQKKNFSLKLYPEATHGFFCNERESYHQESAKDAWEKTKSFFAQHLT